MLTWWRRFKARSLVQVRAADSRADAQASRLGWVTRHANDAVLLLGENGKLLDANERAEELYGYSGDELRSMSVFELRSAEASEQAAAQAQFASVRNGGAMVFEALHRRKDGGTFPVEVSARRVDFGGQRYVQSIVRDISERRRVESHLRESEARYRLLFQSNPQPMWVYDLETLRFLAVNDAAVDRYGYTESEFLAMTIAEIRPEQDRARLVADVAAHAGEVLQRSGVWRHRRKDGSLIDVEIASHSIDFDGRRARLVLVDDITDRMQAERALRASEERYRGLFANASDGILLLDRDLRILAANAEFQAMLGYAEQELRSIGLAALLDPGERPRFDRESGAMRAGQWPAPANWVHLRKDGSTFTAEVRLRQLQDGDVLATVRDLTELLAARRRIERQRDLYDLLSQCNEAIVQTADREDLLQAVTRLAVERGHFRFAWIGELDAAGNVLPVSMSGDDEGYVAHLDLSVDARVPASAGPTAQALRSGQPVVINDFLADARTALWHEAARPRGIRASAAFPIRSSGRVALALMLYAGEVEFFDPEIVATLEEMAADVSHALDALQTRRELEEQRRLLQSIIDASDTLVYALDLEDRVILMNDACARAVGFDRHWLLGRKRAEFLPPGTARLHAANDRQVIQTGKPLLVEERNVVDGAERVYQSTKYPLRDVAGRVYAVGGISTDITELRRMQQELAESNRSLEQKVAERTREANEARQRAEAADRAKSVFLSSMSHELRSPLHSIIGFTGVLLEGLEGPLTAAQQEHLKIVHEASQHLLSIINDVLDISKIEAGVISVEPRELPISRPLQHVLQRYSVQAEAKGLEFTLEGPDPEAWIRSDELRIEQVVSNLVANAIKYTAEGSVVIRCGRDRDQLRVDVVDTGPGIADADQQRVFARFVQLPASRGTVQEGTGLGLAIATGLASALGGRILLESRPGAGSTFSLLLPLGSEGGDT